MSIDTIVGPLVMACSQLEVIQSAAEVQARRQSDHSLRYQQVYTGDGALYFVGRGHFPPDGHILLALTSPANNLVFRHLFDRVNSSAWQLRHHDNYFPPIDEAFQCIKSPSTVIVDVSSLRLKPLSDEVSYLEIDTSFGACLEFNDDEKRLVSVYFGSLQRADGKSHFEITMEILRRFGKPITKIYVLSPQYVIDHTSQDRPFIARVSRLDSLQKTMSVKSHWRRIEEHSVSLGRKIVQN
ncbi:MAG TPA: hypothetical protein VJK72_04830 [Candidatus Nanoarchaeia archaeon]|nr:hypothetical protein [Candidatus Nanoarchaeia archaeon]